MIYYFALLCTRYSRLKLVRPTSCKCVLMIRSRAIVLLVETTSSRIMPWHSVFPCDLRCHAATRYYGGSTPSYGLRFGLVGTFPTVILSRSILTASLSHAVSVREDGHSRSWSSSDTGTVCATPSSSPIFHDNGIFASTCCPKCRGVSGLDEDCSHLNILGHVIEKFVSESGGTTMSITVTATSFFILVTWTLSSHRYDRLRLPYSCAKSVSHPRSHCVAQ